MICVDDVNEIISIERKHEQFDSSKRRMIASDLLVVVSIATYKYE